ncbi:hypothetical protein CW703_05130 [Candidatus Bathyarchaeota archaeon]|nr:MAG: hypothetical protein CW703_05130 [Candidatus Bathyarchaeota archaeon]
MQPIFSKKKGKKLKRKFKIEVRRRYLDYLPKILVLILLAIVVFFISGGLYNLVVRPPPILTAGDRIYFFIPYRLDEQLIGESLISIILLCIGLSGIFLVNRSIQYYYSRRMATIILVGGIAMFVIGVFGIYMLLNFKLSPF